ncbi:MAG: hypothetical protein FWH54_02895 [Methanobrevibacter sp.]|nr:hypothetical protein [Methanobrevibacter sp.]
MVKTKKLLIFLMLMSCFFIVIGSVSAANFNVKDKTSYNDITKWMKTAKNGDSLIFTGKSYNLTDSILIDKAINVKSTKNTKINFYKNKTMFYVISSGATFSNLTLNHKGYGSAELDSTGRVINKNFIFVVSASQDSFKKINFNKVTINTKNSYVSGINIPLWNGNVTKSKVNTKGIWGHGVSAEQWIGNFVNSYIATKGLGSVALNSNVWTGKVTGAKIYNKAPFNSGGVPVGILFPIGKGSITKSIVKVPGGNAVKLDKNIKVTKSTLVSMKGRPKLYTFLPDLSINIKNIKRTKNTYSIKVFNMDPKGLQVGTSNPCYLGIKIGSYHKTVKVKALSYGQNTTVKISIPSKYVSKKYTKTVKVDYYNKVKEENKTNNVVKFTKI